LFLGAPAIAAGAEFLRFAGIFGQRGNGRCAVAKT
jgi:hypothetical protein